MGGTGVIDRFLEVFTRYIDSGFGLLQGEVAFIATSLIVIDVTLAALFWTLGEGDDIIARLIKKTLFIGIFAYIIGNWNALAQIVFNSFAGLGLKASGTGFTAAELLQPGRVAQVGLDAGQPILESIAELMGYISFFENFLQIAILLFAWAIVLLAFFILAIQLFVTLIEFKLATLCGFVLIPFALFGKTAFMAERVLGHVVSSGIKVLVLAVIIGIGSTLFGEFSAGLDSSQPTIEDAMTIALAALTLLGLGIFGPGIANGIVSGGPQLGAGAAVGTALTAGGVAAAGIAATGLAAGALGRFAGGLGMAGGQTSPAATAPARPSVPATASPTEPKGPSGKPGSGANASADLHGSAAFPLRRTESVAPDSASVSAVPAPSEVEPGQAQPTTPVSTDGAGSGAPGWARQMKDRQALGHAVHTAVHSVRAGDGGGTGSAIDLSQKD